jgi:hypothetical protein
MEPEDSSDERIQGIRYVTVPSSRRHGNKFEALERGRLAETATD